MPRPRPRSSKASRIEREPNAQARAMQAQDLRRRIANRRFTGDSLRRPHQQRHALDVVRHREDVHDAERKCDPLRSAALMRRNRPLTCGDAVLGDCGRRSGVAGLCESKRAQSEPSCQRAPTIANDRKPSRRVPPRCARRPDCPQRTDRDYLGVCDFNAANSSTLRTQEPGRGQRDPRSPHDVRVVVVVADQGFAISCRSRRCLCAYCRDDGTCFKRRYLCSRCATCAEELRHGHHTR